MEKNLNLSPPWYTYVSELRALFGEDPGIRIQFNEEEPAVRLYVEDHDKADALTQLLPDMVAFGNVVLKVAVIPANENAEANDSVVARAFRNNPVLKEVLKVETPFGNYSYAVFRKEVVQFFNDNIQDPTGYESMLFEDIARDVFTDAGTFFCTDHDKAGEPLWE